MDLTTISAVANELASELVGRRFGRIFRLSRFEIVVDLRLTDSRWLFVSVEPANPRVYLVRRRLRDVEKASIPLTPFDLVLRKQLSGAQVTAVEQIPGDRILRVSLASVDELGRSETPVLVAQLTGISANLFLLDSESRIVDAARDTSGPGQDIGGAYHAPPRSSDRLNEEGGLSADATKSISEYLDTMYAEKASAKRFQALVAAARGRVRREIAKRKKLVSGLHGDLEGHGNAETWKHYGDLLLANPATSRREGSSVWVHDYFDENAPEIAIPVDENDSLTEAAERYFRRYTKARNARRQIDSRLREVQAEIERLEKESERLETAIAEGDEDTIARIGGIRQQAEKKSGRKKQEAYSGARKFISSDGFDILVGKKSTDNDYLTFRIARSLDTWMHAADYPGSHVVVRNPNRKEIPQRTLIEAAQLAAFYSQGKTQTKAAVHYTQKKFVNKPRGAAPGLVSLASFKSILVEPKIGDVKRSVESDS